MINQVSEEENDAFVLYIVTILARYTKSRFVARDINRPLTVLDILIFRWEGNDLNK
jgi:hypothetical protein